MNNPKKYVSQAVKLQAERIMRLQAASVALRAVVRAIEYDWGSGSIRPMHERAQEGLQALSNTLHERLSEAWNQLAWFGGMNPEADKLLQGRTRSWFEKKTNGIMDFVGMGGCHYTKDADAFRAEVLSFFNMNPKAKKAKKRAK